MTKIWRAALLAGSLLGSAMLPGCKAPVAPATQTQTESRRQSERQDARNTGFAGSDESYRREEDRANRGFDPQQQGEGGRRGRRSRSGRARAEQDEAPGAFDFYLLNLSWSPEFCATHPQSEECSARPGFIVHGLWPQNDDGSYPENCGQSTFPNPGLLTDVMPTVSLIQHEWQTHGTCTGLSPQDFAAAVHKAFGEVRIPPSIGNLTTETMLPPDEILGQFASANPSFPQGSLALSCGNNRLTAIEVCLDKDLRPETCQGVRSCRANAVKITPR